MEVKVTQADREAAALCISGKRAKRETIAGVWDESSTLQSFARHRISSQAELIEALEGLLDYVQSEEAGFGNLHCGNIARAALEKAKGEA